MPLYTFVVDYEGGTYISQVIAPGSALAVRTWAVSFDINVVPNLDIKTNEELAEIIRQNEEDGVSHMLLEGLNNVWCFSVVIEKKTMLVNLVQTDAEIEE